MVGVVVMTVIVCTDDTYDSERETAYDSFPWLTTVGPGGVTMMLVAWAATSEPEELDEDEKSENVAAGLPAYSLVGPGSPGPGSVSLSGE